MPLYAFDLSYSRIPLGLTCCAMQLYLLLILLPILFLLPCAPLDTSRGVTFTSPDLGLFTRSVFFPQTQKLEVVIEQEKSQHAGFRTHHDDPAHCADP